MIKPYRILKSATAGLAYTYLGVLIVYLILRLLFWDTLWIVALVGSLIPWIFFPLFLLPIVSHFILKKRRLLIASSIICLWFVGWLHANYWSPNPSAMDDSATRIKILSLNCTWYKTTPETLVNLVEKNQPDIVFLQEVVAPHVNRAFPELKASYPYQFSAPRIAIISRYPILSKEKIHLAGHEEFQSRNIIQLPGQEIVVYNVQTIAPWIRERQVLPFLTLPKFEYEQRTAEIKDLVQRLERETLPAIAAGDFNLTDQAQDYFILQKQMEDSFKESGWGFGLTWPYGWPLSDLFKKATLEMKYPLFRIDYIWHSPQFGSRASQVLDPTGSEHLPMMSELILRRDSSIPS
ncbi:endonuclease/exonuclease/phosphatase family protein [Phormidium sp. CCY1219]|uniref:endonuclease/exonuclease/phosphatase family protein n=1 Tax=Phormidium sp. CCY1219 TaxID=2886104 RepID=UPI002D1EF8A4|nr:endonuclease/exonuclease/phosphatase family protein [Phormidium sp. CCY1219]MEB3830058.1 endonuclease/exonuclease/phosphatase family protein [Phormidium sp. CCY1219]